MNENETAAHIIEHNLYAAVATSDASGRPWNSPVYVVYDDELNFYWASDKSSQHSYNIRQRPEVMLALYDSSVPWGEGCGVFVAARAEELNSLDDIQRACALRKARVPDANQLPETFMNDYPRRIYRAKPQKVWVNQDARVNGHFVDGRAEADLGQLRGILRRRPSSNLHTAHAE